MTQEKQKSGQRPFLWKKNRRTGKGGGKPPLEVRGQGSLWRTIDGQTLTEGGRKHDGMNG